MTDDEILAMRQRVRAWQTEGTAAPAYLRDIYEKLVEACLVTVTEGAILPVEEHAET